MEVGKYNLLKVIRKSDLGFMLADELNNEVLLHYKEKEYEYKVDEKIKVYIYYDKKNRLCATPNKKCLEVNNMKLLEVKEIISDGIFLYNHTTKDLFLSKDVLPSKEFWPKQNDKLLVYLEFKNNKFNLSIPKISKIKETYKYLDKDSLSYVCNITESGIYLINNEYLISYVPNMFIRGDIYLGKLINVSYKLSNDSKPYYSLTLNKEKQVFDDKNYILNYLKENKNIMYYTFKTNKDVILKEFNMSKNAFKMAISSLYKERKVQITDEYIKLIKE